MGAIGYVEYAYALQNKMVHTRLINHDGATLEPGSKVFQAAAANADWKSAPGFYLILTDQPGKESWPITGATFIPMPTNAVGIFEDSWRQIVGPDGKPIWNGKSS